MGCVIKSPIAEKRKATDIVIRNGKIVWKYGLHCQHSRTVIIKAKIFLKHGPYC